MKPRKLSCKITIDEELEYNINLDSSSEVPNIIDFKSSSIVTYCPECLSKNKLEYSGFYPTKIGYYCENCNKTRKILDYTNDEKKRKVSTKNVYKNLIDELKKIESHSAGYNYGISKSDAKDKFRDYKFANRVQLISEILPVGFMGIILMVGMYFVININDYAFTISEFINSYVYFVLGSMIFLIMSIIAIFKLKERYTDVDDDYLDNVNKYWFKKGLENGIKNRSNKNIKKSQQVSKEYN